ncbi:MAG TPA: MopE-related protein [Candidatus Polarisedimenticolia bacterium]|jgi:hypothetical protein|nr:MopE-related protein [Candidatus Polarisedimenticolia bacterium]
MSLRKTFAWVILAWFGSLGLSYANWTASGTFRYTDREFDQNGFTGVEPPVPIRLATVEVRDANQSGNKGLLATTATDANGNFSVLVSDTKTRTVYVRVLSVSTAVSGLFLRVENVIIPKNVYAVASSNVPNHSPSTNVNFGTITAAIGTGGSAFNIYDTGLRSVDYFAALNGARPSSQNLLTLEWEPASGNVVSSYNYSAKRVHVGDPSSYNDTVIAHETGHYAYHLVSGQDNPGGVHHLTDCNQDVRLAYDEGRATWYGQSVRRYFNLPRPDLYVKTTGAPGPGNLDFYFDVETETPYFCSGSASEVAVYAALWDVNDSASTADGSAGVDDETLSRPDADNWDVDKNYITTATDRSLEDFWDGWFTRGKGFKTDMISAFQRTNVEFYPDLLEPNGTVATASFNAANGALVHQTYFADVNGDGVGEADTDYFFFSGAAGTSYTIETLNPWGAPNTSLELLASNGSTVLATGSSLIAYTPSTSGTLYVRSFHAASFGVYGSYDFRISGNLPVDADGDTYFSDVDCNDSNPAIHPGATEICNGVDDNCASGIDEGFDADSDTYTTCGGDCNDANAAIHPGATEICNGVDDNCASGIDEGFDADSDTYRTCDGDCNDANPAVHPGATEVCNGVDDNCASGIDEGFDADSDTYTTCGGDCNDTNPAVHPGVSEVCSNGIDDNCNSLTDGADPACQVDTVLITKAEFKNAGHRLTVWATSTAAPGAVLTLVGYGTMTYDSANNRYTFTQNNTSNPGTVTVTSSQGGSDTEVVTVL